MAEHFPKNINKLHDESLSMGQRAADYLAKFVGSWTFIAIFSVVIVIWMMINTALVIFKHFDPYPFILLNLVLSCLAAIQAPVILMSQIRLESRDRLRAENDYAVNIKAEEEIKRLEEDTERLHQKIDSLMGLMKSLRDEPLSIDEPIS